MIFTLMIVVFVLGYLAIALEHPIKVDKAASALIIGALGWILFAFSGVDSHHVLRGRTCRKLENCKTFGIWLS